MFDELDILYILPLDESEHWAAIGSYSVFQGFSPGIMRASRMIELASILPSSVLEFYLNRGEALKRRIMGDLQRHILPVTQETLGNAHFLYEHRYLCVLFFKDQLGFVDNFGANCQHPVCKVCVDDPQLSSIRIENISRRSMFQFFKRNGLLFFNKKKRFANWRPHKAGVDFYGHMSFAPAINSLRQFNYSGKEHPDFSSKKTEDYTDKISAYAETVRSIRDRFYDGLSYTPSLIISAPSLYRWLYSQRDHFGEDQGVSKFVRALKKQKGYTIELDADDFESHKEIWQTLMGVRRLEAQCYTSAVSILATNNITPVYRFPYGVNAIKYDLLRFGGCARGNGIHRDWKLSQLRKSISNSINSVACDGFRKLLIENRGHIKITGDIPFEFLEIDRLPLSIEHDVSRLPTAAGNSFLQQSLLSNHQYLQRDELKKVLVIRSFQDDDPIRDYLTIGLRAVDLEEQLSITYKDISSLDEFVEALSQFNGHIMIYDGHGGYDPSTWISYLEIGGEKVDIVQLRGAVHLPEIVITSACDTYPVDGSHASAAHSFLLLGARTVLSTLTPIKALDATVFIARLLRRLTDSFLRTTLKRRMISWSEIVTGLKRMVYVTDLIVWVLKRYGIFHPSFKSNLMLEANMLINPLADRWYDRFIDYLSDQICIPKKDLEEEIRKDFTYSEALSYVQLGNPDALFVVDENSHPRMG